MSLSTLRYTALLEGISWITLLFIAMPLKYLANSPLLVKYVGMIHGLLFVLMIVIIVQAIEKKMIPQTLGLKLFIASLIPFGTFFTDKKLKA